MPPPNIDELSPTAPPQIEQPQEQEQQPQQEVDNYEKTFFKPLIGDPKPGDLITFVYNKQLFQQIHDRQPLVLVLNRKKKTPPDRFHGVNLHYLTNNEVSSIVEMANKRLLYSYDQTKSTNIRWASCFRTYLFNWVLRNTMLKMSAEDIQMEAEIIRQTGLRNLETIQEMVQQQLQQRTQQNAKDMSVQTPTLGTGTVPGVLPTPAIGANPGGSV